MEQNPNHHTLLKAQLETYANFTSVRVPWHEAMIDETIEAYPLGKIKVDATIPQGNDALDAILHLLGLKVIAFEATIVATFGGLQHSLKDLTVHFYEQPFSFQYTDPHVQGILRRQKSS
jgi:hypothetical protein